MNQPYAQYTVDQNFVPTTPSGGNGSSYGRGRTNTGSSAKRGRRPRGGSASTSASPHTFPQELGTNANPSSSVHWAPSVSGGTSSNAQQAQVGMPILGKVEGLISLPGALAPTTSTTDAAPGTRANLLIPGAAVEEDGEGDDDLLPDMADDDYSAQLSWQSQSKDNLKVLMDHFSPEQYDRYEAYRRNALPKQAVRRVVQQTLGHQVSTPVAQVIAGFGKVFVGEIIERAREVQQRRGDTGPLSPDHLREAYRVYQEESGRVGAARPLRGKKLFVR